MAPERLVLPVSASADPVSFATDSVVSALVAQFSRAGVATPHSTVALLPATVPQLVSVQLSPPALVQPAPVLSLPAPVPQLVPVLFLRGGVEQDLVPLEWASGSLPPASQLSLD